MRTRLVLVGLLFVADLLIGPALARLPPYLPLNGAPVRLSQWRTEWRERPIASGLGILNPQTPQDTKAQQGWLLLQIAVAVPVLSLLWPLQTGTLTRNGVPVADPSGAHGTARWRSRRALADTPSYAIRSVSRHHPLGCWREWTPLAGPGRHTWFRVQTRKPPPTRMSSSSAR